MPNFTKQKAHYNETRLHVPHVVPVLLHGLSHRMKNDFYPITIEDSILLHYKKKNSVQTKASEIER